MPTTTEIVDRLVASRSAGETLSEPDAQRITTSLGIGVPTMVVVRTPSEAAATALSGDRVVLKVVGPAHKTDIGGVRTVENTPDAILAAAREMEFGPDGLLLAEFVEHEGEILAGVRWTDGFGPVVMIGAGGIEAETAPDPAFLSRATMASAERVLLEAEGSRGLLQGRRGASSPAALEDSISVARKLLDLGELAMPHLLTDFEINPLVFTERGPVALDALGVVGTARKRSPQPRPVEAIRQQLEPETIAVIGVSERMNPGRMIVRNILAAGFPSDRLTIVKAGAELLEGCRCVPDIESLQGPVDLLVVAVGANAVDEVLGEAMEKARSVILIPGGLGERPGSEDAAKRIRQRLAAAREQRRPAPVASGPNSMGIRSAPGRFDATFIPPERLTGGKAVAHPVAVVAQSGAFTLSRLDRLPWLHPRYVVTVGNQIDLTVADYLEYFEADPEVMVAACYLEGMAPGDGSRALAVSARLRERDGVLLWYRGGRTAAGARSAASHTAAIATDDRVARALGSGAGILEAGSLDDFDDLLRLAGRFAVRSLGGPAIGVVTNAGFESVAAADSLGALRLAGLSDVTRNTISDLLGGAGLASIAGEANPLDLTPIAGDEVFADAVHAVLDDPGVNLGVVGCVPYSPAVGMLPGDVGRHGSLVERLAVLAGHPTPWVVVVDAGRLYDPAADRLEAAGIPVIRSMDRAVRLLGQYAECRLRRDS
ncbi:MAG TPA: acetate--CoA ligase family protein [Acidimicrobiia bacterium]|nr:acetate--CoA ligase family protein [Acidimicrobiia bacterium]